MAQVNNRRGTLRDVFKFTENDLALMREFLISEFGEEENDIPSYLYQYRKININTYDQINRNYIWCASPDDFNDIYDSKGLYKILDNVYIPDKNNSLIEINRDDYINTLVSQLRISSFTSTNNNQTMWSHYADIYSGVCIGYRTEKIKSLIYKVHYINNMDKISKFGESLLTHISKTKKDTWHNSPFLLSLLTSLYKNKSWEYEKEYRYISLLSHTGGNKVKLTPDKIIFGHRAAYREIGIIKKLIDPERTTLEKIILDKDNLALTTAKLEEQIEEGW